MTALRYWQVVVQDDASNEVLAGPEPLRDGYILSADSATVTFVDLTRPGFLNSGDYFEVHGIPAGMTYRVSLVWWPTGDVVRTGTVPR